MDRPVICKNILHYGFCKYGNKCKYDHNTYKIPECKHWNKTGKCPYGDKCMFKHNIKTNKIDFVTFFPSEISILILKKISSLYHIQFCSLVSKRWRKIATDIVLWKGILYNIISDAKKDKYCYEYIKTLMASGFFDKYIGFVRKKDEQWFRDWVDNFFNTRNRKISSKNNEWIVIKLPKKEKIQNHVSENAEYDLIHAITNRGAYFKYMRNAYCSDIINADIGINGCAYAPTKGDDCTIIFLPAT